MGGRKALAIMSATVMLAAGFATIGLPAAGAASGRSVLGGSAAPQQARAHRVGAVSKSSQVSFDLVLNLRDGSGAVALAKAVSTPGSSSYRHYLTAAQWEARFSPTKAQIATAEKWLRSEGFKAATASADRLTISASGTAAQVERAFGTSLALYRVAGHTVRLANRNLSVPASLAGTVAGAMGVNEVLATPAAAGSNTGSTDPAAPPYPHPPKAFVTAPPCGSYYGAKSTTPKPPFGHGYPKTVPDIVCGYKPAQFRSAYGVKPSQTGAGARVAVVDAYDSTTIKQDATTYFARNDPGDPFSNASFTQMDNTPFTDQGYCGAAGWLTEQAIDVEIVHSMATHAHILFVGAKNCLDTGLYQADDEVITDGAASVITNSWDDDSGDVLDSSSDRKAFNDLFIEAAGKGIGMQYSSGDDGDDFVLTGIAAPEFPGESPWATSVGGTTLKINKSGKRVGELGWSTGRAFKCTANAVGVLPGCTKKNVGHWLAAAEDGESGGYTSFHYKQPSYQKGIVPTSLSERNSAVVGPTPMRVTPDISADADPGTGFLIGLTETFPNHSTHYGETRYGGTSLSSPLLAGIVADADAVAGKSVGFLNPTIYKLDKSDPSAIEDILPEKGLQGNFRRDHANAIVPGVKGFLTSFRELYFKGPETYCDGAGNCASRPDTLHAAKGYDSLTGLGAPGANFIQALADG